MKAVDDEKILMIYFNEANKKDVDKCLKSVACCQKLDQLEVDMKAIDNIQEQHNLPNDYGQQLWLKIADQIERPQDASDKSSSDWLTRFKQILLMPQFSLASLVVVMGMVLLAFYAGQQQNQGILGQQTQEQLLAQNIQLHLSQSEIFLTQVSNGNSKTSVQATAQKLLASNRIFKQALTQYKGQFTSQLLTELEPLLLEFANGTALKNNLRTPEQIHGKQAKANWVNDSLSNDLMFQIKAMKQQLAQKNDII